MNRLKLNLTYQIKSKENTVSIDKKKLQKLGLLPNKSVTKTTDTTTKKRGCGCSKRKK